MLASAAGLALSVWASGAAALDEFAFRTPGADEDLRDVLLSASLVNEARRVRNPDPQDLFAAAQADYARLLGALYGEGYYSGVISIRIDGREAAEIDPLDEPDAISEVVVSIQPGPRFRFASARMRPYAPGTALPPAYGDTRIARSGAIADAAQAGVDGWRNVGHAKAEVADDTILADHARARIDALILLDPGPRLRFGELRLAGYERMRPRRLAKIAGFPTGEVYDPKKAEEVAERVQRTGVFRSVSLTEAEQPNPDGTLDFVLTVAEEAPRRLGFGAELSSLDGLTLTGFWLHRNLLGGGERFRVEGEVSGIGAQTGDEDYRLNLRIDRPATLTPNTSAFLEAGAEKLSQEDYDSEGFSFGLGFTHVFSPELTGEIALRYENARVTDDAGTQTYQQIALPVSLTWDRRDSTLNPTEGFYVEGEVMPFYGLGSTDSGARATTDLRAYRGFGQGERPVVIAGRVQAGTILGASIEGTPRDYLFYTGGGGTVRGHPFQSLGVSVLDGGTTPSGGMSFVALSAEARVPVGNKFAVVAFADAGYVDAEKFFGGQGEWQSGAGLGIRYDTGIGPIRLDIAAPLSGDTDEGVQFYVGIGQSF